MARLNSEILKDIQQTVHSIKDGGQITVTSNIQDIELKNQLSTIQQQLLEQKVQMGELIKAISNFRDVIVRSSLLVTIPGSGGKSNSPASDRIIPDLDANESSVGLKTTCEVDSIQEDFEFPQPMQLSSAWTYYFHGDKRRGHPPAYSEETRTKCNRVKLWKTNLCKLEAIIFSIINYGNEHKLISEQVGDIKQKSLEDSIIIFQKVYKDWINYIHPIDHKPGKRCINNDKELLYSSAYNHLMMMPESKRRKNLRIL